MSKKYLVKNEDPQFQIFYFWLWSSSRGPVDIINPGQWCKAAHSLFLLSLQSLLLLFSFQRSPGPLTLPLQVCVKCHVCLLPVLSAAKSCWFCSCCPSLVLISLLTSVSPFLLHLRLSVPHSQSTVFNQVLLPARQLAVKGRKEKGAEFDLILPLGIKNQMPFDRVPCWLSQ